jgi:hypothetical protein
MPFYLVIDTNTLYNLVSDTEYSSALKRLEHLIQYEYITLLKPSILATEWEKHREKQKDRIEAAMVVLRKNIKQTRTAGSLIADLKEDQLFDLKETLLSQITSIGDLLSKKSIHIEQTPVIDDIVTTLRSENKAPFHKPGNHTNDAIIIYSAIDYLLQHQISRLFFVSNNTKQFAQPGTLPSQLHKDIAEFAGDLCIDYSTNISDALKKFDELGLPGNSLPDFKDLRKIASVISVDRTKPILFQILDFLKKRFEDWAFIPKVFFNEHYPFILSEYFEYYYRPFTLVTDNTEVFSILKNTRIEKNDVKDFPPGYEANESTRSTLKEIFQILHNNLIYRVAFKNEREVPFQYIHQGIQPNSHLRYFRNFDFSALLKALPATSDFNNNLSAVENMKIAYAFYKIGNYKNAALLYKAIRKSTEREKNIYYYIACFSTKKLAKILELRYSKDQTINMLIQESDALDLNRAKNDSVSSTSENRALIEYIHNIGFIRNEFSDLYDNQTEIRSLMNDKSSGKTQTTERILEAYFSIDAFLSDNSIVYDMFSEFHSTATIFAEALIMSYTSSSELFGRLSYFSDPLLAQYILHCKERDLTRYIYMYSLKAAEYHHEENDDPIFELPKNLLTQRQQLASTYGQSMTADMPYFWENYASYIERCLIIYSFWKFPAEQVVELSQCLIDLLRDPGDIFLRRISSGIHKFISQNEDIIPAEHIEQFFIEGIRQKHLHNEDYFFILSEVCEKRRIQIPFTAADFSLFIAYFINKCPLCNIDHSWHFVGDLYAVVQQQTLKSQIKTLLNEQLANKFDQDNYYLAATYDILDYTISFNQKYIEEISKILDQGKRPRIGGMSTFYFDSRLDHFINFCWKFQLELSPEFCAKASSLSTYYKWLCDLDNFDYSKFDPQWLSHHFSLFYKRQFRKSLPLKEAVFEIIKDNPDKHLQFTFIMTYGAED